MKKLVSWLCAIVVCLGFSPLAQASVSAPTVLNVEDNATSSPLFIWQRTSDGAEKFSLRVEKKIGTTTAYRVFKTASINDRPESPHDTTASYKFTGPGSDFTKGTYRCRVQAISPYGSSLWSSNYAFVVTSSPVTPKTVIYHCDNGTPMLHRADNSTIYTSADNMTRFYSAWRSLATSPVSLVKVTVQKSTAGRWTTVSQKSVGDGYSVNGTGGVTETYCQMEDYRKELKSGDYRFIVAAYNPAADNGTGAIFTGTNSVLTRGWAAASPVTFKIPSLAVTNVPTAVEMSSNDVPWALTAEWNLPKNAVRVDYKVSKNGILYRQGSRGVRLSCVDLELNNIPSGSYGLSVRGVNVNGLGGSWTTPYVTQVVNAAVGPGIGAVDAAALTNDNSGLYQSKQLLADYGTWAVVDALTNPVSTITSVEGKWTLTVGAITRTVSTRTMTAASGLDLVNQTWPVRVGTPGTYTLAVTPINNYAATKRGTSYSASITVNSMSTSNACTGLVATNMGTSVPYMSLSWTGIPYAVTYRVIVKSTTAGVRPTRAVTYTQVVSGPTTAAALSSAAVISAGIPWKMETGVIYSWTVTPINMFGRAGAVATGAPITAP